MTTTKAAISTRRSALLVLGAFAIGIGVVGGGFWALLPSEVRNGTTLPRSIGGPFRLSSSQGGVVDSRDLVGQPFLIFFGFTRCPNVCPTTLADLTTLIDDLHKENRDIRAYFITIDPERDTPDSMRAYLDSFSDRIVGLSGTPTEIVAVAKLYRAYARKVRTPNGDYTMEHTAAIYLMDAQAQFVTVIDPADEREGALSRIRIAMTKIE